MDHQNMHFVMLNTKIYRNIQIYLDKMLKKYELSSGSCPYIFMLEKNEGISQNRISKELSNDKAMSARTITKLIELGYVYKEEDEKDSRAYKLYMTEKLKTILPEIHQEMDALVDLLTENLSAEERLITMKSLITIYEITKKFKE